jgi:hypothetical protein
MYKIYHYYNNNNLFRSGFFIGAGITLIICSLIYLLLGCYIIINYGLKK